ncbi:MAG: M4 family metallopeptidase, partial [Labilithrix sp.]|nr:M4 family metallopeptidase [Labilithrix sp.]
MRLSRLVVLIPLSSACVTAYGCSPAPDPSNDISSRLAEDTGVEWAVRTDETNNEVRFLSPEKPVRIGEGTPEEMARAFFDHYRAQLHGTGAPDELRAMDPVVEDDGTTHVRFEHYLPGTNIPVLASASTAHFTGQGEVYYLQPGFRADLAHVSSKSAITEADAIERAVERASAECDAPGDSFETRGAELAVRGAERLPALLVWRVPMRAQAGSCTAPEVLVDATTGEVASLEETAQPLWDTNAKGFHFHHRGAKSDVKGIDVTKSGATYSLQSTGFSKVITRSYGTKADGKTPSYKDITTTTLGSWPSTNDVRGTEVDAHYHAMHALEFWKKGLPSVGLPARHGLDGRYGNTILIVHDNSKANSKGNNAYCAPSDGRFFKDAYLHFGDGDFRARGRFLPFAAAYDVVVHETAHAVTRHTSKLVYAFESGALNESFSDVMAAAAERALEGGGDAKNFLIGERMTTDGKGLRNMADPPSRGSGKDSVEDMLPCAVPSGAEEDGNDFCH